ncbi:hypothetical protein BVX95_02300 [archaeon D22]|nr:hypothetical protein BVX95_02300 [archaeon D22]
MKKIVISMLMILTLSLFVSAQENQTYTCESLTQDINLGEGVELPKYVPFKNEIVNIYMNNESLGSLQTEKGKVTSFGCEMLENPTYNVYIKDSSVIDEITASESPLDTINEQMKNKDIDVQPVKTGKKVKWFFSKIVIKIGSWFS